MRIDALLTLTWIVANLSRVNHFRRAHAVLYDDSSSTGFRSTSVSSISLAMRSNLCLISRRSSSKDRKSTRLNSSHVSISYAVFCLKKKIKYLLAVVEDKRSQI